MDSIERFEAGARDHWQRPAEVIAALALVGHETAVDLGAGTGYFARHLTASVRRLIAVEPERALRARLAGQGFECAEGIGRLRDPVDLIFAANVLRFLAPEELGRIGELTRRIVLIDWKPGPRPIGPPQADEISLEEAIRAFPRFRTGPTHDFLPYQWMVELERVD